jgi:phage baseplate assembly protein gpV
VGVEAARSCQDLTDVQRLDAYDAVTINIGTTAKSVTINMGSSNATVNITGSAIKFTGPVEITGDLTVDGNIIDKGDLSIGGIESGGGTA